MWRELSKPWSTFTSRTSLQAECLMIDNEVRVFLRQKISRLHYVTPIYKKMIVSL